MVALEEVITLHMPRTMENGTISTIAQLELVRRVAFVVQGPTYYFISVEIE